MRIDWRPILLGGLVAGAFDLTAACIQSWIMAGRTPIAVLQSVATGPFGDGMRDGGLPAALLGLATHFTIATLMAATFVFAARRLPALVRHPVPCGLAYGVGLYLVMYWVVLPLRYPAIFPQTDPLKVALALAYHTCLVGLSIALIAAHYQRKRGSFAESQPE